jgi:hypothetical protein
MKTKLFIKTLPLLGILRRNNLWHFVLTVKRLSKGLNFWCLVKEKTDLLDNLLSIEIVEHVKLLLCDRRENSFEWAL